MQDQNEIHNKIRINNWLNVYVTVYKGKSIFRTRKCDIIERIRLNGDCFCKFLLLIIHDNTLKLKRTDYNTRKYIPTLMPIKPY